MLRHTVCLLRRGKPRPRAGMFPDKYRRVPQLLKPQQGGQQYFSQHLLRAANDDLLAQQATLRLGNDARSPHASPMSMTETQMHTRASCDDAACSPSVGGAAMHPQLPEMDLEAMMERTTAEHSAAEMAEVIRQDGFQTQRVFNERQWWESERERQMTMQTNSIHPSGSEIDAPSSSSSMSSSSAAASVRQMDLGHDSALPERVLGADYFASRFGYSLLKDSEQQTNQNQQNQTTSAGVVTTDYAQLDLWGEMPKYHREMIFLYLISRRRNTYAVAYDYDGRRLLTTYTAGNRGLKGGDRGFRGDGSTDNGHQVTSMYLNDLLPKIREQRASQGRPMTKDAKIDLVVRVMGFYNGRQGAIRAVQDRSSEYRVRYLEDITPFPLNGPKMPRGVFR